MVHSIQANEMGWRSLQLDLGQSLKTQIDFFVCSGAKRGPSALVAGGIHGDEYEGPAAIGQFAAEVSTELLSGTVVLVPVANPPAFEAGSRVSPLDGVNLARVFPGKADGSPTERLADSLFSRFAGPAGFLIDLHSGGVEYEFLPVAGFYGAPGLNNPSYRAAVAMRLPALWQLPETNGVLSREFTRIGKAAVGAEYLGGGSLSKDGVRDYVSGIKSCLAHWGIWNGALSEATTLPKVYANDWLLSPATGLFRAACRLGEQVADGDELAVICDRSGCIVATVPAQTSGVVLGLRHKAYIRQNDWAVLVGNEINSVPGL
jgi:predicted deacylase